MIDATMYRIYEHNRVILFKQILLINPVKYQNDKS